MFCTNVCNKIVLPNRYLSIGEDKSVFIVFLSVLDLESLAHQEEVVELKFVTFGASGMHLVPQGVVEGKGDLRRNVDEPLVEQPT